MLLGRCLTRLKSYLRPMTDSLPWVCKTSWSVSYKHVFRIIINHKDILLSAYFRYIHVSFCGRMIIGFEIILILKKIFLIYLIFDKICFFNVQSKVACLSFFTIYCDRDCLIVCTNWDNAQININHSKYCNMQANSIQFISLNPSTWQYMRYIDI